MQITLRTAGLLAFSTLTAGITATMLATADGRMAHASAPQVAVLHELPPPPRLPPTAAPVAEPVRHLVDNPSALQVAGNPRHFVGSHVRWTCTVDIVPEPTFADAYCGPHVPLFAQPPLTAEQMQHDPDAVAQSIAVAQRSLHGAIRALNQRALIVLTGPVQDLDHGEVIVIDGTVRRPLHGENAFGITRSYPTVHVDSIAQ